MKYPMINKQRHSIAQQYGAPIVEDPRYQYNNTVITSTKDSPDQSIFNSKRNTSYGNSSIYNTLSKKKLLDNLKLGETAYDTAKWDPAGPIPRVDLHIAGQQKSMQNFFGKYPDYDGVGPIPRNDLNTNTNSPQAKKSMKMMTLNTEYDGLGPIPRGNMHTTKNSSFTKNNDPSLIRRLNRHINSISARPVDLYR